MFFELKYLSVVARKIRVGGSAFLSDEQLANVTDGQGGPYHQNAMAKKVCLLESNTNDEEKTNAENKLT